MGKPGLSAQLDRKLSQAYRCNAWHRGKRPSRGTTMKQHRRYRAPGQGAAGLTHLTGPQQGNGREASQLLQHGPLNPPGDQTRRRHRSLQIRSAPPVLPSSAP